LAIGKSAQEEALEEFELMEEKKVNLNQGKKRRSLLFFFPRSSSWGL